MAKKAVGEDRERMATPSPSPVSVWEHLEENVRREIEAAGFEIGPKGATRVRLVLDDPPTEEDPDDARILQDFFGFPVFVEDNPKKGK